MLILTTSYRDQHFLFYFSVYFGGKACLKKHIEPTCGKPYADALVEASHLFSEEIPGNCEPVSGVSIMQASVLTLLAAGSLLILGRV